MLPTYFINRPNPIVLTKDGRINFLPFDMVPDTIVVNGIKGLVGNDGLSVIPINQLVNLGYLQPNAGTPANPLRVEGKLINDEEGNDKETGGALVMSVLKSLSCHTQPACTSTGPSRNQTLAGKYDRTV